MNEVPELKSGYTVRLHLRISEGKKDRVQVFEGIIISIKGKSAITRTITVRKEAKGYGVEKIIPLAMPTLEKIEIVKKAKVRKQRLYYVKGYTKRLKEEMVAK